MESEFRNHITSLGSGEFCKMPPSLSSYFNSRKKEICIKLYGECIAILSTDSSPFTKGKGVLHWLVMHFSEYPLDGVGLKSMAVKLFAEVRNWFMKIPHDDTSFADIDCLHDHVLEIQPLEEFIYILLQDNTLVLNLLAEHEEGLISAEDVENEVALLPFHEPSETLKSELSHLCKNPKSRVSLYILILRHIERLLKTSVPNESSTNGEINSKVCWLVSFMNISIISWPLKAIQNRQVCKVFTNVTVNGYIDRKDGTRAHFRELLNAEAADGISRLKTLLKEGNSKSPCQTIFRDDEEDCNLLQTESNNPVSGSECIRMIREKELINTDKLEGDQLRVNSNESLRNTVSSSGTIVLSKVISLGIYSPSIEKPPSDRCVVNIENVWLQVDPIPDRIVFSPNEFDSQEHDEILTSIASGTFLITRDELIWAGDENAVNEEESNRFTQRGDYSDLGVCIPLKSISSFSMGQISNNHHAKNPAFLRINHDKSQGDKVLYYISIQGSEALKFFPLQKSEATQIVRILTTLTGNSPFSSPDFVKRVLHERLLKTRITVLRHLEGLPNPWIEHTQQLTEVITKLTKENVPHSIYDLERLYHSCRLQTEVTKEALHILRKRWKEAPSEQIRLKILVILDRLLDRAVLHPRHENFNRCFHLLQHLERNLDPYKSCESLKSLLKLLHRANELKHHGLSSVTENQFPVMFENWDDYVIYASHM